jgi:6-phosphogluconate dehydrogenase
MAVESELRKRKKLDNVNTIDDVVNLIQTSSNIIALVGAGSSVSSILLTNRNKHKLRNP